MVFLIFLFGILLAAGLFFIMADLLKLPRLATQRAMLSVGRQEKKQAKSVEALLMGWAVRLAPHIHMDEYKRGRLRNTLAAAGLNMTPEEYTAFAMVQTSAVLLAVIPCLLVFPLLALVVVLLAVAVYFKEIRRAEEKLSVKRDEDGGGAAPVCGHHHTGAGCQPGCAKHDRALQAARRRNLFR